MADKPRRSVFFWFVLLLCGAYTFFFAFTAYVSARSYGRFKDPGWTAQPDGMGWIVAGVDEAGAAAGRLERGDRLLAIDGDARAAVLGVSLFVNVGGDETYRIDLDRHGQRLSVDLLLPLARGRYLFPIQQVCGLVFFICGAALGLLRPQDGQVRFVSLLMMSFGFTTLQGALGPARPFLVGWERSVILALAPAYLLFCPMTYHIFSRFPTWRRPGPLWRSIQWVLYALFVLVFGPAWVLIFLRLDVTEGISQWLVAHPWLYLTAARLEPAIYTYMGVCMVLALVVATRNYRHLPDPGSRRRVRWVMASLITTCGPVGITIAFLTTGWISQATHSFWYPMTFLPALAIPAAVATAVWKEQLFDVRVIVRRGLQYLFARAALRALLVLPIALLAFSIFRNPDRTVGQILTQGSGWLNLVLIAAIGAVLRSRKRLQTVLDRRFFREAYEQEQVLVHLIDEVRQRDSLAEIAQLVTARINAVLHPTSLHIFYRAREDSEFVSGRSASQDSSQSDLPADSSEAQTRVHAIEAAATQPHLSQQEMLLRMLDGSKAIRDFPAECNQLPTDERSWLEKLNVRLIVPISGSHDRLVGVLLLGGRMSDEPYSATDKRLLEGIAGQIGLVYENQYLRERVLMDADVRRNVLGRLDEQGVSLLKECPRCGTCYDGTTNRCEQDDTELVLTLPVERTLNGKYRLERALGRGGFGVVYEASDLRLERRVAAKVMVGSSFGDVTALRRFEREARAAAKIDHRHITRVHDYGAIGSGGAYLIMELVSGRTWRAELNRSRVIAPPRACEWFGQLLEGLQFAHNIGVIHRDLKPENVMIVEAGDGRSELKIMDFGLAKILTGETRVTDTLTQAGAVIGTFGYIAPEVFTGGAVDERADIFAIGVMVVETLVGERPFGGQTTHEMLTALLNSEYHLPGSSTEIRALDAVVQRCLAKDPRDRYGSATEVAEELLPALSRCQQLGVTPRVSTVSDTSV